jgi:hypothetical protein
MLWLSPHVINPRRRRSLRLSLSSTLRFAAREQNSQSQGVGNQRFRPPSTRSRMLISNLADLRLPPSMSAITATNIAKTSGPIHRAHSGKLTVRRMTCSFRKPHMRAVCQRLTKHASCQISLLFVDRSSLILAVPLQHNPPPAGDHRPMGSDYTVNHKGENR